MTRTEENLDKYLADPKSFILAEMGFPGLKSEEDRQNIIAYLKQNS